MMPVKFKIGFQIDAETLFGIIAKFLPLEEVTVEEVVERAHAPTPRLPKQAKLAAPKPVEQASRRRQLNLDEGVNAIIMGALADGEPHRASEIINAIAKDGRYATNGMGSRIPRLLRHGYIVRPSQGMYQLAKAKT